MTDATSADPTAELAQDHVPLVFLCETTGQPMTDAGFCPEHRADGCIAAYRHHRETDRNDRSDARRVGYLPDRAEWASVRLAEPDDDQTCERCLENIPPGTFYMRFVALAGHDIARCWDAVSECRDCASGIGFAAHFDGLPLDVPTEPSDGQPDG